MDKNFLDKLWDKNQIQTQSDLIRINLLNKYGGIWIDATLFCNKPLDEWLKYNMHIGFLLFRYSKKNKIASWFIASNKNNYISNSFCTEYNNFWENRKTDK